MTDHYETKIMVQDATETKEPVPRSGLVEIQQLLENSNTQGETEMDRLINLHPTEISIEMENWFSSIAASSMQPRRSKPRIQKVPHWLKSFGSNAECFEPSVISLGPIHSNNPHLQQMNQLKAQFMDMFASDYKVSYQDLYDKVASVLNEAKDCYEASTLDGLDDTSFCQMMCLDGCFILRFLYMFTLDGRIINEIMQINDISHVRRDLFLLENQIPFVILHALMSFRTNKEDFLKWLLKFEDIRPLPQDLKDISKGTRELQNILYPSTDIFLRLDRPIHLLDLTRTLSVEQYSKMKRETETASSECPSYKSAKELKTVGIHFCKAKRPLFTEVSFENNLLSSGILFLPPLSVDYHTKSKLLNMAAYEACPDALSDMEVTSYICFMSELINQADDVKVLRSDEILFNKIGSDQLVADLFNEIANGLVQNPKIYNTVRHQIKSHYKNKWYAWIAHWTHKYLTTPWTVCGLLAAVIIIVLTATRTVFTIFPRH